MDPISVHIDGLIYAKQAHGGISRNFTNLINAFAERSDVEVNLYLEAGLALPDGMSPVRIRKIPDDLHIRPSRFFHEFSASLSSRRRRSLWSSAKSGVFHSSCYSSPEGLFIPQILSMHDTIYEDYPSLFSSDGHRQHLKDKQHAFRQCNALVFPSEFTSTRTNGEYDLSGKLARTIPHAIDARFRAEPPCENVALFYQQVSQDRPFLLHVGSRYLHKNVARLLEAYSEWDQRFEIALVLAGGGPLGAEERELIDALGIGDEVIVIPRLTDGELVCAYHAATAFVFPSLSEGFGFPVLEALACGCPTACSDAASLPEVGGSYPVYFDPADIDSIHHALTEVVESANNHARWESARALALQRTWCHVATEYIDFYKLVISHSRH